MKTISLACRGGGVKSAGSVGIIKALNEMGFTISRISGTSISSIIAALYSTGTKPDDILQFLKDHVLIYSNASRVRGNNGNFEIIETSVDTETRGKSFEECNIPLTITASSGSFLISKPVIFSKADFSDLTLGKACRASCSFPFLYNKYHLHYKGNNYALLDGGLTLNPFISKEDNEVAILSTYFKKESKRENTLSLYAPAWQQAEKLADFIIKPIIPLGTLGNQDDLQMAFNIGYQETIKNSKKIESLVLG